MQAKSGIRVPFSSTLGCLQFTLREDGVRALYKGMLAPVMAQGLYKAVMFAAFSASNELLERSGVERSLGTVYASGVFAGTVNSVFVCPVELVRNRLMVQRSTMTGQTSLSGSTKWYSGTLDCIRQTIRSEPGGVLALWRGFTSTALRDGPGVGMWFMSFEIAKQCFPPLLGIEPTSGTNMLLSGAMGGIGFWVVSLPFDTVKSNIQTSTQGSSSIRNVVSHLGIRGLYTGLGIALIRGIPGAGIVFLVQGFMENWLEDF